MILVDGFLVFNASTDQLYIYTNGFLLTSYHTNTVRLKTNGIMLYVTIVELTSYIIDGKDGSPTNIGTPTP